MKNHTDAITGQIVEGETALAATDRDRLAAAGQAANQAASAHVFADYRGRRAANTLRRQDRELANFCDYLAQAGIARDAGDLATRPDGWQGVTWGIVEAFKVWLLGEGYAIGTVNLHLSTVKAYAGLAVKAGTVDKQEYAMLRTVQGYTHNEGKRLDEKRADSGSPTRIGEKKAEPVMLTDKQAKALKRKQPDTPQGRRDALLMALLLDLGLRVGEVALLTVGDFDLRAGELTLYRPKVGKEQTHELKRDVLKASQTWFDSGDAPLMKDEPVLRGSRKGGHLTSAGMSDRAITRRVRVLGERVGIDGLSAHDCRHFWATHAARSGTSAFALQQAGGWSSLTMPARYVEAAEIANEDVKGF